jgi:hypothetical protein
MLVVSTSRENCQFCQFVVNATPPKMQKDEGVFSDLLVEDSGD